MLERRPIETLLCACVAWLLMASCGGTTPQDAGSAASGTTGAGGSTASSSSTGPSCMPPLKPCGSTCIDTGSDVENCGACGHSCLGGPCQTGTCLPVAIATGEKVPILLTVAGKAAYWWDSGDGSIRTVPTAGGSVIALATDTPITGLVADETHVFWTSTTTQSVMSLPITGGTPTAIASGFAQLSGIAMDSTFVYFATVGGTINKVPKAGGAVVTLATGELEALGVAVDAVSVYWSVDHGNSPSQIRKAPINGGATSTLITTQAQIARIAIDSTSVYWFDVDASTLLKLPLAGGAPKKIADIKDAYGIATDATHVYFTKWVSPAGLVQRVPSAGGAVAVVAAGQNNPGDIALDATAVYWTVGAGAIGNIMKVAK